MTQWLVGYQQTPLAYTSRRTAIVVAQTGEDAMLLVQDALIRVGDGTYYMGLTPVTKWNIELYKQYGLGAYPYVEPAVKGSVVSL